MTPSVSEAQFRAIGIRSKTAILADVSVRYLSCGDTAFTVEFGNEISPEINGKVMALHVEIGRAKAAGSLPGVVETVPTMRSLMVSYDPLATSRGARPTRPRRSSARSTRSSAARSSSPWRA